MWKLLFAGIIVVCALGAAFFAGFVIGSTVTPLASTSGNPAVAVTDG